MDKDRLKRLWDLGPIFVDSTPHGKMLGIKFVAIDIGRATLSLPYSKNLVGNKESGVLHGGVLTTILDQSSGLAAISAFKKMMAVATLDLRIDYMRAAEPGKTIIAEAHAYKTTRHIAFVRGIAHEGDIDDPVATSQASFMTTAMNRTPTGKAERLKAVDDLPKGTKEGGNS